METRTVVVGTRDSALARAQTGMVIAALGAAHPEVKLEVRPIRTGGDRDQQSPLSRIGGQGVFVKEIEQALLAGEVDLAVHSLKDMPSALAEGLTIGAFLLREDPRDALVSRLGLPLRQLPPGARVGTGSLRRQVQLRDARPDLEIVELRGNVDTRLLKAKGETYDAIVLAVAGLRRLGRSDEITEILPPDVVLPAVGQGAIAVQVRADDARTLEIVAVLDDAATRAATTAERSFLRQLGSGCQVPAAAYALREPDGRLWLRGLVAGADGATTMRGEIRGPAIDAERLGAELAQQLLAQSVSETIRGGTL